MKYRIQLPIKLLLITNLFAAYIGSWLSPIYGAPAGAAIRDVFSFLIFLCSIVIFLINFKRCHKNILTLLISWLFLCSWCLVLMLFSENAIQSVMGVRSYILFPSIFISLFVFYHYKYNAFQGDDILDFIIYIAIIASLIAIIDVILLGQFKILLGYRNDYAGDDFSLIDSYDGRVRASAGFSDALNFGYFLSVSFLLCVHRFSQKEKLCYLAAASLIFVCTVMTLTRGAIICNIISCIFYFYRFLKDPKLALKIYFTISFLLILAFINIDLWFPYVDLMVERFTDSSATSKGSTQGRFMMAYAAMDYLADQPLGVGLGTQGSGNIISSVDQRVNTDNYFFWMALETGVIGLFLNLLFIFCAFYYSLKISNNKKFIMMMIFIYIFSAAVSSSPSSSTFSIVFWVALISSLCQKSKMVILGETNGYKN